MLQLVVRVVDDLAGLLQERQRVAARALGVDVVEQAGRDRAAERDPRAALVAEREHPLAEPRRDELERVLRGVLEPRALDVDVEVGRVDELRAVAVGAGGERAHDLLLADLAADRDDLAGLDVGAEADEQVGEALQRGGVEAAGIRHRRHTTPPSPKRSPA